MLEIKFDGQKIDDDYVSNFSQDYKLFTDNFYLGSTSSNTYYLELNNKEEINVPTKVEIVDNNELVATMQVDRFEDNKKGRYEVELVGYMVNFNFSYDASTIIKENNGEVTLLQILEDICSKAGVVLKTKDFGGFSKKISWYNSRITARDYISFISECAGGFAKENSNGELEIAYFNNEIKANIKEFTNPIIGEKYNITKVVYDNEAGVVFEKGDDSGTTLYLNKSNVFITEQEDVDRIYEKINGFSFYNITVESFQIPQNVNVGELISFEYQGKFYPVIFESEFNYFGKWFGGISTNLSTSLQQRTQQIGIEDTVKNLEVIVDRDSNSITQLTEQQDEQSKEISKLVVSVESISQKVEIIEDFTSIVKGNSVITLTETILGEGYIVDFKLKPLNKWNYLYPTDDLFPSPNLLPSLSLFPNNELYPNQIENALFPSGNTVLMFADNIEFTDYKHFSIEHIFRKLDDVADEFILEKTVGYFIQNIGLDNDGLPFILDEPIVHNLGVLNLPTFKDKTFIKVFNQVNSEMEVKYITDNDFSETFATTRQLESEIEISRDGIMLSVEQDLETATDPINLVSQINLLPEGSIKMNASKTIDLKSLNINLTADEITIDSNNFSVTKEGKVTATAGDIAGFVMDSNSFSKQLDGIYEYTIYDLMMLQTLLLSDVSPTEYYKSIYDTSGDGQINSLDLQQIFQHLNGTYEIQKNVKGNIFINSNNPKKCLTVESLSGEEIVSLGMGGIESKFGSFEQIAVGDSSEKTVDNAPIKMNGLDGKIICVDLIEVSKAEKKKDFEILENALDIVNDIDVYKYRFQKEEKNAKKHIGMVIGDKFKYSKEITDAEENGVNTYAMSSVNTKAIQELYKIMQDQQIIIENLKEEINKMKKESKK